VEETRKRYEGEGYTGLHVVFESGSRPLIDVLEKVLIVMYMKRDPRRNQNEQIGGGELKGSDAPYIYIAIEDAIMTALKKYSP
jgi:hypothetical protein